MLAVAVIGEHPDTNSTDVPKRTLWRPGDHQPMRERVAELKSRHKLYCSGAICRMLQCDLTYRIERCDALAMLRFRHCAARRSPANERESSRAEEPTLTRQSADRNQWYFFINIITKPLKSYCGGGGGGGGGWVQLAITRTSELHFIDSKREHEARTCQFYFFEPLVDISFCSISNVNILHLYRDHAPISTANNKKDEGRQFENNVHWIRTMYILW